MHLCDMDVPGLMEMMVLFLWQWLSWPKLQKWQLVRKRFEPYGRWLMLFVLMLIQQWFKRKRLMNWQDFVGKGMKLLKCKSDHHIIYIFVAWWVGTCVQCVLQLCTTFFWLSECSGILWTRFLTNLVSGILTSSHCHYSINYYFYLNSSLNMWEFGLTFWLRGWLIRLSFGWFSSVPLWKCWAST